MILRFLILIQILFSVTFNTHAKEPQNIKARRINEIPKIDGVLDDQIWDEVPISYKGKFKQFLPENGKSSPFTSEIKIAYSDFAVYVSARLYDPNPDSIFTELGLRDEMGRNTDLFGVSFDTYGNGQNAYYFVVSAAGVQTDIFISPRSWQSEWDAVWKSATQIDEKGWVVEMEIPYSALRFPKQENQLWGVNFMREVKRSREESYWNRVDNSVNGFVNQFGKLTGIKQIKPPTRLSFLPYVTAIASNDGLNNKKASTISGGMDLKYGINESYTLDVSLIPDFSQVQSDNVVLNLSPFEVKFNENRPFFTEGTELFNKGNLFYSRRIGQSFGRVSREKMDHEEVVESPSSASMINATKISGRNSKGLGIGFFNAVTEKNQVLVENEETSERRKIDGDPLTNFNVIVVDKNLKNNSTISLINTNVTRADKGDDANVTGTDFRFINKSNSYALSGFAALSQIFSIHDETELKIVDRGFKYTINFSKVSGKYRFSMGRNVESDRYDVNDLGYIARANEVSHHANFGYHIFKPGRIFNRLSSSVGFYHGKLYEPNVLSEWQLSHNTSFVLKNFWQSGIYVNVSPEMSYDYFEPRVDGWYLARPASYNSGFWVNTDSRKVISLNARASFFRRSKWNQLNSNVGFGPKIRVNDKLSFNYNLDLGRSENSIGYVTELIDAEENLQNIIFGSREIQTFTNTFGGRFIFNNKMGLNLRMRHYWSKVAYSEFYDLGKTGGLEKNDFHLNENAFSDHNKNFNALNIDLIYSWQIAPGSFMNVVFKDAIISESNDISNGFSENFGNTIASPQVNSVSIKLLYFLDYFQIKKKWKSRHPEQNNDKNIIAYREAGVVSN